MTEVKRYESLVPFTYDDAKNLPGTVTIHEVMDTIPPPPPPPKPDKE